MTLPSKYFLGLNAKAYYSVSLLASTSAASSQTWVEMADVKNVTLGLTKDEFDISTRGDGGYKLTVGTLLAPVATFNSVWRPSDAALLALLTAFLPPAGTEIALLFMDFDKGTSGARGFAANFNVFNFPINQDLPNALMSDIVVKPSSMPQWWVKS